MRILHFLFSGSLLLSGITATAQPGSFDSTFGTLGKVTNISPGEQHLQAMAVLPDGYILGAGYYAFNFSPGAFANIPGDAFMLRRFLPNGAVDTSFGTSGVVHYTSQNMSGARAIALQSDYKAILAGISTTGTSYNGGSDIDVAVMRINTDSSLDTTFGTEGIYSFIRSGSDDVYDVKVQHDDKILVAGYFGGFSTVLRLTADGVPDETFGTNGFAYTLNGETEEGAGTAKALHLLSDGSILVAKQLASYMIVSKLTPTGQTDVSFGINGGISINLTGNVITNDITVSEVGNIYVCGSRKEGSVYYGVVVALTAQGAINNTFGTDGIWIKPLGTVNGNGSHVNHIAPLNGKLILGISDGPPGNYDFSVAAMNPDATLDTTFGTAGYTTFYFTEATRHDYLNAMALTPDEKILVGGWSTGGVSMARLNGVPNVNAINTIDANAVMLYPNPVSGRLNISLKNSHNPDGVKVYDNCGRLVYRGTETTVDVTGWQAGLYAVSVIADGKMYYEKLIVK